MVWNAPEVTAFVRKSASWSLDLTNGRLMIPFLSFSFMKCLSITTRFIWSCWIQFSEILIAVMLSQYNFASFFMWKIQLRSSRSHEFLLFLMQYLWIQLRHLIGQLLSTAYSCMWQHSHLLEWITPEVDFLSSWSPVQSALV